MAESTRDECGRLILIGALPPPRNGQSVAFGILTDGLAKQGIPHHVINFSRRGNSRRQRFSLSRLADFVLIAPRIAISLFPNRRRTVYLQIGQSLPAFCRDCVIIWTSRLSGAKIILHLFGGNYAGFYSQRSRLLQQTISLTLRLASSLAVESHTSAEDFKFHPRLANRVVVIPNGIEVPPEAARDNTPKKQSVDGAIHVLYLSALIESKGYIDLLESAALLKKQQQKQLHYHFAGSFVPHSQDTYPSSRAHFFNRLNELNLATSVSMHGSVKGKQKIELLEQCAIFVLPTWYINEGFPLSIIEAMAYGLVVISTNYRGIPEMVIDNKTGLLIEPKSPTAISEAIKYLCDQPAAWKKMSNNSRERFSSHYTRELHIEKMTRLIADIHNR